MTETTTTNQVIPWYRLKARLEELQAMTRASLEAATGEEIYRLQGESRLLRKLMNLPETLAMLDEEDLRVEAEALALKKGK